MKKGRIILLSLLLLVFAALFFALRGPNISNALKTLIIPELESATGQRFFAGKISVNLFPLFIEIRDLQGLDDRGQRFIKAGRVKGYIGLSGLMNKEILIRRLVVREAEISAGREKVEEIIGHVEKYLAKESEFPFKVVVKSLEVGADTISLADGKSRLLVQGLRAEGLLKTPPRFRIAAKKVSVLPEKGPQVYGMMEARFAVRDSKIDLSSLRISSRGSVVKLSGGWDSRSGSGEFRTELAVLVDSLREFFGLRNKGEGSIRASGGITLHDLSADLLSGIGIEIKAKGNMYLETLMEILKVKERLEGKLTFSGEVKGPLNNLIGKAEVRLKQGNIYGVEVDSLATDLLYRDGLMSFLKGKGEIYGGKALAEASITLPVVHTFTLHVKGQGMSSKGLFRLIRWDPGIPEGEVSAELSSAGAVFAPVGSFAYTGKGGGKDVLGRVQGVAGQFSMADNIIRFPQLTISTGLSAAAATGTVDLGKRGLALSLSGRTTDLADLSAPYFTAVSGAGEAEGQLGGSFDDPFLDLRFTSGKLKLFPHSLHLPFSVHEQTLPLTGGRGDLRYRKNLLQVREFHARSPWGEMQVKGEIRFPKAKALFDVASPSYNLHVSARDMAMKEISESLPWGVSLRGSLSTSFTFTGEPWS
ncbi:MAG: AsmA-like C-terminal region-containing protein [Thermodesulfovibrionales bacterium]|jgi:translocation and assembly module TamB